MALLMAFSVLNNSYYNGQLMKIEGTQPGTPAQVNNPVDTGVSLDPNLDRDPLIYAYMDGSDPHVLVVNYRSAQSIGLYTVYDPSNNWAAVGTAGKRLQYNGDDVAINPRGVARVGGFLFIIDYDTTNVYQVSIVDLKGNAAIINPVAVLDLAAEGLPNAGLSHGVTLLGIGNDLFGLYMAATNPWGTNPNSADYKASSVVKMTYDPSLLELTYVNAVEVGKNAFDLVPYTKNSVTNLFVPCIGTIQQYGYTNADWSRLDAVNIAGNMSVKTLLTGDGTAPNWPNVANATYYDIRDFAVNEAGKAFLLLGTYSQYYATYWKLFQADADILLALASPQTLSTFFTGVTPKDHNTGNTGDNGYYWSTMFENAAQAADSRFWFIKGYASVSDTAIKITDQNYGSPKNILMSDLSGNPQVRLPNIDSASLIAEMTYQASKNVAKSFAMRGYQAPQVASGAFVSTAAFMDYEAARRRMEEKHGK
jgi:hypothetical protein